MPDATLDRRAVRAAESLGRSRAALAASDRPDDHARLGRLDAAVARLAEIDALTARVDPSSPLCGRLERLRTEAEANLARLIARVRVRPAGKRARGRGRSSDGGPLTAEYRLWRAGRSRPSACGGGRHRRASAPGASRSRGSRRGSSSRGSASRGDSDGDGGSGEPARRRRQLGHRRRGGGRTG
jgi:hypothetical protein